MTIGGLHRGEWVCPKILHGSACLQNNDRISDAAWPKEQARRSFLALEDGRMSCMDWGRGTAFVFLKKGRGKMRKVIASEMIRA